MILSSREPKLNPLIGAKAYLSGPIENDHYFIWRDEPKKILREQFQINLFDPCEDEKQNWSAVLTKAREKKNYETLKNICKSIVRKDLSLVDRSDLLIACLFKNTRTFGTTHEIILSNEAKKPTIIVCPDGKEFIPYWLWGIIKEEFMFDSWQQLYCYLDEVNQGKHINNNRWHYLYGII